MRAARGLLANKLNTPEGISKAPLEEEVEALHSEGNIQRGTTQILQHGFCSLNTARACPVFSQAYVKYCMLGA